MMILIISFSWERYQLSRALQQFLIDWTMIMMGRVSSHLTQRTSDLDRICAVPSIILTYSCGAIMTRTSLSKSSSHSTSATIRQQLFLARVRRKSKNGCFKNKLWYWKMRRNLSRINLGKKKLKRDQSSTGTAWIMAGDLSTSKGLFGRSSKLMTACGTSGAWQLMNKLDSRPWNSLLASYPIATAFKLLLPLSWAWSSRLSIAKLRAC